MHSILEAVRPRENLSAGTQIADSLRQLLTAGTLKPGDRLPPTCELAALWHTSEATVQRAFLPLVRDGLLRRVPRAGTFVQERMARLTRVGVYHQERNWGTNGSCFTQAVHAALRTEWRRQGVEVDAWVDPRPIAEQNSPWPTLVRAAQERRLQAVIALVTDWPHIGWLRKLPVPVAYLSSTDLPNCVTTDLPQFMQLALQDLRRQGCRSVGLLPAFNSCETTPDGLCPVMASSMARFVDLSADLGLALRDEWVMTPTRWLDSQAAVQRFGYEKTLELWRQPQQPEGLVVTDDVAATGVVVALLELGVKVPDRLKLVLQKNSDVDLFCPLPATLIELSTPAVAAALIEQVRKQTRGEECSTMTIGFQCQIMEVRYDHAKRDGTDRVRQRYSQRGTQDGKPGDGRP